MTILVIADDEGVVRTVPIARVDALISCGDLPDQVILNVADRVGCSRILAVKGNHDGSGAFDKRITDLHLKTADVNGMKFGGFCGSWKYKPRGNYLFEQAEVITGFVRDRRECRSVRLLSSGCAAPAVLGEGRTAGAMHLLILASRARALSSEDCSDCRFLPVLCFVR